MHLPHHGSHALVLRALRLSARDECFHNLETFYGATKGTMREVDGLLTDSETLECTMRGGLPYYKITAK